MNLTKSQCILEEGLEHTKRLIKRSQRGVNDNSARSVRLHHNGSVRAFMTPHDNTGAWQIECPNQKWKFITRGPVTLAQITKEVERQESKV